MVAQRLLTLAGFGLILLGAFVPWPNLLVAGTVVVLGALLMASQIPIAMRDGSADIDQLEALDRPDGEWQRETYPQFPGSDPYTQTPSYSVADKAQAQPEAAPAWRPTHIPGFTAPAPYTLPEYESPAPLAPVTPYQPAESATPHQPAETVTPHQPATEYQPATAYPPVAPYEPTAPSQPAEPSPRRDETAQPWRPRNIPQYPNSER